MVKQIKKVLLTAAIVFTIIIIPYYVSIGFQNLFMKKEDYIESVFALWVLGISVCLLLGFFISISYAMADTIMSKKKNSL